MSQQVRVNRHGSIFINGGSGTAARSANVPLSRTAGPAPPRSPHDSTRLEMLAAAQAASQIPRDRPLFIDHPPAQLDRAAAASLYDAMLALAITSATDAGAGPSLALLSLPEPWSIAAYSTLKSPPSLRAPFDAFADASGKVSLASLSALLAATFCASRWIAFRGGKPMSPSANRLSSGATCATGAALVAAELMKKDRAIDWTVFCARYAQRGADAAPLTSDGFGTGPRATGFVAASPTIAPLPGIAPRPLPLPAPLLPPRYTRDLTALRTAAPPSNATVHVDRHGGVVVTPRAPAALPPQQRFSPASADQNDGRRAETARVLVKYASSATPEQKGQVSNLASTLSQWNNELERDLRSLGVAPSLPAAAVPSVRVNRHGSVLIQ